MNTLQGSELGSSTDHMFENQSQAERNFVGLLGQLIGKATPKFPRPERPIDDGLAFSRGTGNLQSAVHPRASKAYGLGLTATFDVTKRGNHLSACFWLNGQLDPKHIACFRMYRGITEQDGPGPVPARSATIAIKLEAVI